MKSDYKQLDNAGLLTVKDILDERNHIMSFDDICSKVGVKPCRILEYNVVSAAVKTLLRVNDLANLANVDFVCPLFCGKSLSTVKDFRLKLTEIRSTHPCAEGFWKRKLNFEVTPQVWLSASLATKETRLRLLHWKIIHNIFPTNILLCKMKVKENNKCSYCTDIVDVIEHFYYECPLVLNFWQRVQTYIQSKVNIKVNIDALVALFGLFDLNVGKTKLAKINHILLIARMCISIYKKTSSTLPLEDIFRNHLWLRKI